MSKEELEKMENNDERFMREMIMSCLCYGYGLDNQYINKYKQVFSEKQFNKILKSQADYFNNHCKVAKNVGYDSEGNSYNSIIEY